jgi:uncharacterized protein (TIGR02996 family)
VKELLDAIVENPDDDAPRRVYADALLDRGDPYGEFINVQIDLATDGLSREARIARRIRERKLLAAHGWSWSMPFDRLGLAEPAFRRGFVDELTLDADTIVHRASEVLAIAPLLRNLTVRDMTGLDHEDTTAQWSAVLASPVMPRLAGLRFDISFLPYAPDPLPHYEAVQMLAMAAERWPRLVAIAPSEFGGPALDRFVGSALIRRLAYIDLSQQEAETVSAILGAIPVGQLRGLRVDWRLTDRFLHEPLRSLELAGASPQIIRAIGNATALANLRELDLGWGDPPMVEALADAERLESLGVLRFSVRLSLAQLEALLEYPVVKRLEVLDLRGITEAERHRDRLARRFDGSLLVGARPRTTALGGCW